MPGGGSLEIISGSKIIMESSDVLRARADTASTLPGGGFIDNTFRISDNGDNNKKLAFECSGITSGQTRTMTVPDASGTISTESFATAIAVALG